jgi:tetratricopeptide (TPR) repeat protein
VFIDSALYNWSIKLDFGGAIITMSNDTNASQIGRAWSFLRQGQPDTAIKEFEKILQNEPDNIDANYGMGLAQRAKENYQAAIKHFQHGLQIVDQNDSAGRIAREAAANDFQTERIKPNTAEDDRYMMLTRMLKQRLAETQALSPTATN